MSDLLGLFPPGSTIDEAGGIISDYFTYDRKKDILDSPQCIEAMEFGVGSVTKDRFQPTRQEYRTPTQRLSQSVAASLCQNR